MNKARESALRFQGELQEDLQRFDAVLPEAKAAGVLPAQMSWWTETARSLAIAAENAGSIELDPYSSQRYNSLQRSIRSAMNCARANDWVAGLAAGRLKGRIVSPDMANQIHFTVMYGILELDRVGVFRTRDVRIADPRLGVVVAAGRPPGKIREDMNELAETFQGDRLAGIHPLIKSGLFQLGYARIHPHPDGNGRCSRITINGIHVENGLTQLPFPMIMERERATYNSEITDALKDGNPVRYLRWHINAMREAAIAAAHLGPRAEALGKTMTEIATCPKIDKETAARIARSIVEKPIATAAEVAERAKTDEKTVREALWRFESSRNTQLRRCKLADLAFFVSFDALSEIKIESARVQTQNNVINLQNRKQEPALAMQARNDLAR